MTMFKSMTPSTEASWPYTETTDDISGASITPNAWSRIVAGIQMCRASLAERRRIRRASGELERLDDRMLRDIGVTRSEIGRAVRHGPAY
jgi:uncharacterized protein YjiS (DUF1127 family)